MASMAQKTTSAFPYPGEDFDYEVQLPARFRVENSFKLPTQCSTWTMTPCARPWPFGTSR